jgi:hypothetical protein
VKAIKAAALDGIMKLLDSMSLRAPWMQLLVRYISENCVKMAASFNTHKEPASECLSRYGYLCVTT